MRSNYSRHASRTTACAVCLILFVTAILSACNGSALPQARVWFIAYDKGQATYQIRVLDTQTATDQVILVVPPKTQIVWGSISPNGRYLSYVLADLQTEAFSLWLATSEGRQTQQIYGPEGGIAPYWLNNDNLLIYYKHDPSSPTDNHWTRYNLPSQSLQSLDPNSPIYVCASGHSNDTLPWVATYGKDSIILGHFVLKQENLTQIPVLTMDLRETSIGGRSCLSWSRDGQYAAFAGVKKGANSSEVFVQDHASTSVRQLTSFEKLPDGAYLDAIAVSPDGKSIIVGKTTLLGGNSNQDSLGLIRTDGGAITTLASRRVLGDFFWSSDNRFVFAKLKPLDAARSSQRGALYQIDTQTGNLKQLTMDTDLIQIIDVRSSNR